MRVGAAVAFLQQGSYVTRCTANLARERVLITCVVQFSVSDLQVLSLARLVRYMYCRFSPGVANVPR